MMLAVVNAVADAPPPQLSEMLAEARSLVRQMDRERAPWADAIAASVRASIRLPATTTSRSQLRELRQTLPTADQLLLVLRVERELAWKDLSHDVPLQAVTMTLARLASSCSLGRVTYPVTGRSHTESRREEAT